MLETVRLDEISPTIIFESSKARQQRRSKVRTSQSSSEGGIPPFLIRAGATLLILGGSLVGGKCVYDNFYGKEPSLSYQGNTGVDYNAVWKLHRNSQLPKEVVLAIGEDIRRSVEFPGFFEVGELIVLSQTNSDQLQRYIPLYTHSEPFRVRLSDLGGPLAQIILSADGVGEAVTFVNKRTEGIINSAIGKWEKISTPSVGLDNSLVDTSNAVKKLMFVKEFSHILYMREQEKVIMNELTSSYNVMAPDLEDLASHIFHSALSKIRIEGVDLERYAKVEDDLDCTGHWHTLPAFGKMRYEGLLSSKDLWTLGVNNRIFEAAVKAGLLLDHGKGTFGWKSGIGPFSADWLSICRPLWRIGIPK